MPSAKHNVRFIPGELPKSDRLRLADLLFGGAAANTNSPTAGCSAVAVGAGASGVDPATTHAEPGAGQVRSVGGALQPPAPARPGSATTEAVA